MNIPASALALLGTIVGFGETGGAVDSTADLKGLHDLKLVEVGNNNGQLMARAKPEGITYYNENSQPVTENQGFGGFGDAGSAFGDTGATAGIDTSQATPVLQTAPGKGIGQQAKPKLNISVVTQGFTPPTKKRSPIMNAGQETYPFATMAVGAAFFVANSDVESGDAVKTLSSAVSAANRRYAKEVGSYPFTAKGKTTTRTRYQYNQYFEYAAGTRDQNNPQSDAGVWVWRSDKKTGQVTGPEQTA